ncbi:MULTISPECIES: hypothetical protein [unclassified Leucobacter]|uniref:hypothetical protein n=1 Tax=unclassified Leucobacter TaxID=2621730 RepID=UPI00165DEC68|nr:MULTISPECIES: hypothetical protein [unclassified Leucobacter]MBC9935261.1 hypothetical protein [Leucobacter sp. cx-87]
MTLRRPFAQVGQVLSHGSFFSVWSWLVTAPFAITLLGGYDSATTPTQRMLGIAVAAGVHVVIGGVGSIGALLERRVRAAAARTAVVLATMAVLGALRPLFTQALMELAGVPGLPVPMAGRILTNLLVISISLTLIALATSTLRRRREVLASLATVTRALECERTAGSKLRASASAAVYRGRERLLAAVPEGVLGIGPGERSTVLLAFSEGIVRPVAHEFSALRETGLASANPDSEHGFPASAEREISPHLWVLSPPPLGLPTLLYVLIFLPFLLQRAGAGPTLWAVLVVGGCGALAENALARGVDRCAPRTGRGRALSLLVGYTVVSIALSAAAWLVLPEAGISAVGPVTYLVIAVASGLCAGHLLRLAAEEERLAAQLLRYRADEYEGRRSAEQVLADAAEWVHGEVQSACLTAVVFLSQHDDQRAWERELGTIRAAIERIDEPRSPVAFSRQAVEEVLAAWGRVIDCDLSCDANVWPILDASPASGRVVVDALSEALTNILRHAARPIARVRLELEAGAVTLRVSSPGTLEHLVTGGSGVRELRRRADRVELTESMGTVQLTVGVRVGAQAQS